MFGSYNEFNARVHIDAQIVSIADFLTRNISFQEWPCLCGVKKGQKGEGSNMYFDQTVYFVRNSLSKILFLQKIPEFFGQKDF